MKKVLGLFLVAVAAIALAACGKKEFAVDGEFTAFELDYNRGVPMYTSVDVTIEKGKIVSYYIDARQGKVIDGEFKWNEKTKKELKEDYGMTESSEIGKEWYEQAEALETYMLENGVEAVKVVDGYIDGVTGVSIKDGGYTKLAKEAIENAKNNKFLSFKESYTNQKGSQFTWAVVTTNNKGKVTEIFLDCIQSTKVTNEDNSVAFNWNEKSKKELQEDYGMKDSSEISKEWYEQAEALETYMLENGVDSVKVVDGYIDGVTGVSIKDGDYRLVVKAAIAKIK